jgi:hypothetical protein
MLLRLLVAEYCYRKMRRTNLSAQVSFMTYKKNYYDWLLCHSAKLKGKRNQHIRELAGKLPIILTATNIYSKTSLKTIWCIWFKRTFCQHYDLCVSVCYSVTFEMHLNNLNNKKDCPICISVSCYGHKDNFSIAMSLKVTVTMSS